MWLKLSNGREELVVNEDHIKRLLDEGAVEIADPTAAKKPLQDDSSESGKQEQINVDPASNKSKRK